MLDGEKNADAPPADAVELAVNLLDRQNDLVEVIANAFWEEFRGRGPDSGMWWYDSFNRPDAATLFKHCPIASAEDELRWMRLQCMYVRNDVDGWSGWVAHLCFWAEFEEEHDVGVLTDGQKVVGTGYLTDVVPYGFEYEEYE